MATSVWWYGNNLDWGDPTNWKAAEDGTGSALVAFAGDEYFRFTGTGAGADQDCSLVSAFLDCAGFDLTTNNLGNIIAIAGSSIIVRGDDNDVSGYVVVISPDAAISGSSNLTIYPNAMGEPVTIHQTSVVTTAGFREIYCEGDGNAITIGLLQINIAGGSTTAPITVLGTNLAINLSGPSLRIPTATGSGIADSGSSGCAVELDGVGFYGVTTAGVIIPATLAPFCTGSISLGIIATGTVATVPDWVASATALSLYSWCNQLPLGLPGPATGNTSTWVLPKSALNGTTMHLDLEGYDAGSVANVTTNFFFTGGGGDWEFAAASLTVSGGRGAGSVTVVGYDTVQSHCRIDVASSFFTYSSLGSISWGVNLKNWSTNAAFDNFSVPSIAEWRVPPVGMAALDPINVTVSSGAGAAFCVRAGAPLNNLTALSDVLFQTFTNASVTNLTGKLTLGAGAVTWGNQFIVVPPRINLATGANAAAVLDASLPTSFAPVVSETDHLEICNPNAFKVYLGGAGCDLTYVESVCGDVGSYGIDSGNNIDIIFEAPSAVSYRGGCRPFGLGL